MTDSGYPGTSILRARFLKMFLCSLSMHLAVLWLLWQGGPIEYGAARNMRSAGASSSVLTVRIVASEKQPKQAVLQTRDQEALVSAQATTIETKEVLNSAKQISEGTTFQGYAPSGRLTRLPVPLTDIDLNATEIDEVALEGEIELTILIDVDGTVADVLTSVDQDRARAFANRVAARFRTARFAPGEIDGKAVKSALQITVVSEPRSQAAGNSSSSDSATLGR